MSTPFSRPAQLTDAQREILSAATARSDGALLVPARLKGNAARSIAKALLDKGLAREVRAKGDLPAWRTDAETGRGFALVVTKAGRALVPEPVITAVAQPVPAAAAPAPVPDEAQPLSPDAPRQGSKLAEVIALLGRQKGTSVDEMMAATGWLPHTTRAALSGLRKRGYALTREPGESGSLYRIGAPSAAAA